MSKGEFTSWPYIKKAGVCIVTEWGVVLKANVTESRKSSHVAGFFDAYIFTALNNVPFNFSLRPFEDGRNAHVKIFFTPICGHSEFLY